MRIARSTVGIAAGLIVGFASSSSAQLTVRTPEQKHDRMSLTTRGHADTHSKVLWKMQASMDATLALVAAQRRPGLFRTATIR